MPNHGAYIMKSTYMEVVQRWVN